LKKISVKIITNKQNIIYKSGVELKEKRNKKEEKQKRVCKYFLKKLKHEITQHA